jgi:hypothetical protein
MYFKTVGADNTDRTLALAAQRAQELGITELVVASSSGDTALRALELCPGLNIICVSYHAGFREPFKLTISDETRVQLIQKGVRVVAASHALSGAERGLSQKLPGSYPVLIVAETLRLFGQGVKVAVEVALMAADAGMLSGKPVIAIGGTGKGADAALVLSPAHTNDLLKLRVHEIICKPSLLGD